MGHKSTKKIATIVVALLCCLAVYSFRCSLDKSAKKHSANIVAVGGDSFYTTSEVLTDTLPAKLRFSEAPSKKAGSKKINLYTMTTTVVVANKRFIGAENPTSGAIWIKRVSKRSDKPYRAYLGYKSTTKYNGNFVWHNKAQTDYWYYTINPTNGFPKKNKLVVNE